MLEEGTKIAGYSPLKITGMASGLITDRENFLLPDDAYPKLRNAYVWRERIKRKPGCVLLGRLQRTVTFLGIGNTNGTGGFATTLSALLSLGNNASIVPGSLTVTILDTPDQVFTETLPLNGELSNGGLGTGSINYVTTLLQLNTDPALVGHQVNVTFSYYPGLPVMGIRTQEEQNSLNDQTIFFDQVFAYIFNGSTDQFQEYIPGTTWNAAGEGVNGVDFFWSTNYWVGSPIIATSSMPPAYTTAFTTNNKLFWVTNNSGHSGVLADPPRITDGTSWLDFYHDTTPLINSPWAQIGFDGSPIPVAVFLTNWLSMLPFRGRMVTFNTWEGTSATNSINYSNRIRWSTIGNPFIPYIQASVGPPAIKDKGSWRDDIRGQGGFLDIPTSEDIVSIGFVRDNLVIYCERSTWQLRYTGRSIAPFQIERVNSELGGEGPFSAVQFDTSLIGVGDKGLVECDSYKSERIDIKIVDFVFQIQNANNGNVRVHGIRDFINRLAFWTCPITAEYDGELPDNAQLFPNIRLVYNYENKSWAIFEDSYTALGNFQPLENKTWINTNLSWIEADFSWIGAQQTGLPAIVGGNQQGYVEYLTSVEATVDDVTLFISGVLGHATAGPPITGTATVITSPNHNLVTGDVIGISGILPGTAYDNLNGGIFGIVLGDNTNSDPANKFRLFLYDPLTGQFTTPQLDVPPGTYIGVGQINVRENFSIVSKKFNFLDEGQSIQMGFLDILMDATEPDNSGAISLNVYLDYNDDEASNTIPNNNIAGSPSFTPDTFFNSIIPTTPSTLNTKGGTKFWQRVICPTRANFLTLEYTFSNAQLNGIEQQLDVQIDAQVLWIRRGGRNTQI